MPSKILPNETRWRGTTKLHHIEGAAKALNLELTAEEYTYLKELYIPYPLVGVMAQNTAAAENKDHVWSTGNQVIESVPEMAK